MFVFPKLRFEIVLLIPGFIEKVIVSGSSNILIQTLLGCYNYWRYR